MYIEFFLKFYTAFADDKSQTHVSKGAEAEISRRKPTVAPLSAALHIEKSEEDADAHSC